MRLHQNRFFNLFQDATKKEVEIDDITGDDVPYANAVIDLKGQIVQHGTEFLELTGYSKSQLKNASIWKLVSHASAIHLRHTFSNISPAHPFVTTDVTVVRKNQSPLVVEMVVNYYTQTGQELLFCIFRNVDHDRKMMSEINTLKNHYKLLAEHSAYVQILLNADFKSLYISPSCKNLSGYTPEEAKLINLFSMIHPDDFDMFWDVLTQNQPENFAVFRFRFKHKDKRYVPLECQMHIIPNSFGQAEYYVLNLHDITRQNIYEQELIRAHKEAQAAHHMKNNFLASITHELRTPLNAIIGFARLLEQYVQNPECEKFSQHIESSGLQLLGLIDNLLEFARIENNEFTLEKHTIDLDAFFRELAPTVRQNLQKFNKGDLEIIGEWDIDTSVPMLYSNQDILRHIFVNLLDNALKFTREGFVRYGCKPFGIRQYLFYVEDSGIGIPPDAHEKIFEKFTQLDQSLSREFGGTGLGLTVTKRFIDLLGGEIWVISEKGKGSSFFFKIPIGQAPSEPPTPTPLA